MQTESVLAATNETVSEPGIRALPKVGVVILNYNGKTLAESCLRSALNSDYANREIILVENGSTRIQCAGGMIPYTQNVCSERGSGKIDRGQYDKIEDVDYFPGCGFMARRELLEQLDFLDESFYGLGYEDTDFCMRAVRSGY